MADPTSNMGPDAASASPLPPQPQLFQLDPIDVVDGWQQVLVDCYQVLGSLVGGKSQAEAHDILQRKASASMHSHNDLVSGLVYGVLTVPADGSTYFRYLNIVSRDGFAFAISRLQLVATAHRFSRLRQEVRAQLFWILSEMIKINVAGVDQIVMALIRQLRSGDVAQNNVTACRLMLRLLQDNHAWLLGFPMLVATVAYAFGRLVLDHSRVPELRTQESELVVRLLRERFVECSMVGRDLVRMLQDVAKVPVFRDLWRDIMHRPRSISAQFEGVEQLLRVPTPRMFLANRLTFEMESRLLFILEQLPAVGYSRNLMWFVHRYLSTPESESLVSDLIRYIIGVFHPSNAVLASNIVPRYVFLGGLLRFIRSQVVAANAKLALFYDWLFYTPGADNIMSIEPGVLIIARSVDRYTYLTTSFIEFLGFAVDAYSPQLAPLMRKSVGLAMLDAVEKGVIPSIVPICEHPKLDPSIRRHMQQLFPQLVPAAADQTQPPAGDEVDGDDSAIFDGIPPLDGSEPLLPAVADAPSPTGEDKDAVVVLPDPLTPQPPRKLPGLKTPVHLRATATAASLDPVSRMFQDEVGLGDLASADSGTGGDSLGLDDANGNGATYHDDGDDGDEADEDIELVGTLDDSDASLQALTVHEALGDKSLWLFGSTLRDFVATMAGEQPDVQQAARSVKEVVDMFAQSEASVVSVARVLSSIFTDTLELEDIETNVELVAAGEAEDTLEHDLLYHLFAAAAHYLQPSTAMSDSARRVLLLLVQLTEAKVDVGFRWLLYGIVDAHQPQYYVQYVDSYARGSLRAALVRDLTMLKERFPGLFYTVLPRVYAAAQREFAGCRGIVKAVVSLIDQPQVYRYINLMARGQLRLFGRNKAMVAAIITATMECDVFQQVCLWQLLNGEAAGDVTLVTGLAEHLLLQCELDPTCNSEAANGLLSLLRTIPPTVELLQVLAKYVSDEMLGVPNGNNDTGEVYTRTDLCGSVLTSWLRASKCALLGLLPSLMADSVPDRISVPVGAAQHMISRWTERFAQGFDFSASSNDCMLLVAEISNACKAPPSPPVPAEQVASPIDVVADDTGTDAVSTGGTTRGNGGRQSPDGSGRSGSGENSNARKRRGSDTRNKKNTAVRDSPPETKSRRTRTARRTAVKRRRRNVDTSDEDDNSNSSSSSSGSGDNRRAISTRFRRRKRLETRMSDSSSGHTSLLSSPILSSASSSLPSDSDNNSI